MRVLVTGGTGFIGSHLIDSLVSSGIEVRALYRSTSPRRPDVEWIAGDLLDAESLERATADVDVIYHVAGAINAPDRAGFFQVNEMATRLLATAASKTAPRLKKFIYVSSLAAAGPAPRSDLPRQESDTPLPVSYYGESKLAGERVLLAYSERFPVAVIRPPIVYGPRDKALFGLIKGLARFPLAPVIKASNAESVKTYSAVYVADLVEGLKKAGEAEPTQPYSVYFLSGDQAVSFEYMIDIIRKSLGKGKAFKLQVPFSVVKKIAAPLKRILGEAVPFSDDKLRELQPDFWICSNEKAKRMLGFSPQFDFERGMKKTVEWYRENKWL